MLLGKEMKMFQAHHYQRPFSPPRDGIIKSWLITTVIMVIFATVETHATSDAIVECCPGNSVRLNSTINCSDGSKIRLHCVNDGLFFSLNPEDNFIQDFKIVENDGKSPAHLELLYINGSIPATEFCVSGKYEKDRWALVCYINENDNSSRWKSTLYGILSIISAIFLFLTLVVYLILPELREIQDKAMACTIGFLACSYVVLGFKNIGIDPLINEVLCIPLALLLYWTFLSAFFWMNLVSFNVWRSVWFKNFPIQDKALFWIYCVIGFVGPTFFVTVTLTADYIEGFYLKPRFGENSCWFGGHSESWAFYYGPIACLLALNMLYFGLTCWRLWYRYRDYNGNGLRSLRFNCLLYVKLFLIMGLTWIFDVISFALMHLGNEMYWIATDILNCLQGVIIFILLVATRKRVKRLLAKRKPCGIIFPKSWSAYDEDDEIAPALAVDIEL